MDDKIVDLYQAFAAWFMENPMLFLVLVGVFVLAVMVAAALIGRGAGEGGFTIRGLSLRTKGRARGIVLGKKLGLVVCSPEKKEGHVVVIGSSGSGKTQVVYLPTLRAWRGHWLAFDAAGDLEKALRRKDLRVFAPDDDRGIGYNVFYAVDLAQAWEEQKKELAAISAALIPESELQGENASYFAGNARNVLTAALWCHYAAGKDFAEMIDTIAGKDSLEGILDDLRGNDDAWRLVAGLDGQNERNLAGVYGELRNSIGLFATSARLMKKLNRAGVSPAELERSSLLISFPPGRLEYYSPLCRLLYAQTLAYCYSRPVGASPRILLAIDELPKFGRIDVLGPLEQIRKFGVRLMLCFQSIDDLRRTYRKEEANAILENCLIKAVCGVADVEGQEYFSKLAGQRKVKDKRTTARITKDGETIQSSESIGERWEPSIRPEAFARLRKHVIIFHRFGRVARLRKWYAYKNKKYMRKKEEPVMDETKTTSKHEEKLSDYADATIDEMMAYERGEAVDYVIVDCHKVPLNSKFAIKKK